MSGHLLDADFTAARALYQLKLYWKFTWCVVWYMCAMRRHFPRRTSGWSVTISTYALYKIFSHQKSQILNVHASYKCCFKILSLVMLKKPFENIYRSTKMPQHSDNCTVTIIVTTRVSAMREQNRKFNLIYLILISFNLT